MAAVHNILPTDSENHLRFRLAQPGAITGVATSLAIRQIPGEIGGLSKGQNRPKTETGYLLTKTLA